MAAMQRGVPGVKTPVLSNPHAIATSIAGASSPSVLRKPTTVRAATPTTPTTPTSPTLQPDMAKFTEPDTPVPDYEDSEDHDDFFDASPSRRRNSTKFVNNFKHVITNIRSIEELHSCFLEPEPDPDYLNDDEDNQEDDQSSDFPPPPPPLTADELSTAVSAAYDSYVQNGVSLTSDGPTSAGSKEPPQIRPKPLHNPCVESKERQALHRELLMNYKIGKDVLQKPELNKVLRDRRETARKKEWEEQKSHKGRTSLELKLEERANRMKEEENTKMKVIQEDAQAPELLRVHRKITKSTSGGTDKS